MNHDHVVAALAAALKVGALTADAVALEARLIADADAGSPGGDPIAKAASELLKNSTATSPSTPAAVTSLPERRLAQLPPDTRPLPSLEAYDQLLPSRRIAAAARSNPTSRKKHR
jgi:hypothetical protein